MQLTTNAMSLPNRQAKAHQDLRPPNAFLMMLEGRAPWEWAAMLAAAPWLYTLPRGDGHPVLVFPGLGATDFTTAPLRAFLRSRGYVTYAWKQGFNFGPRHGVLDRCRAKAEAIADKHQEPLSLIGWSLGGIYAREIAKEMPQRTRSVITLGTPFSGHPRATNAWRFYQLVSGQTVHEALVEQIREAPPVPTTSIYSRTDGVVAWQCSLNESGPQSENIELQASHVGMGVHPLVLYAIADRLAQGPGQWKPFDASGSRRWFFRTPDASDAATA